MEYHKINIALVPPQNVQKEAYEISRHFDNMGNISELGGKEHVHLTLYYAAFPVKNIKKIVIGLQEIFKNEQPIRLVFDHIRDKDGYIAVDLKISDRIRDLHKKILNRINPYREGYERKKYREDSEIFKALPKRNKEIVKKWGHPYLAEMFIPHITLAQFDTSMDSGKIKKDIAKWNINSMILREAIVYEQSPLEEPYRVIARFKLK